MILEPRRRINQVPYAVVMEADDQGISTRSVDALVEAMGIDSGLFTPEVSRICAGPDETVGAFRARVLTTSSSPTSTSTPPTSTSATPPGRPPRWPWWSPPESPRPDSEVFWKGLQDLAQAARPGRGKAGHQ